MINANVDLYGISLSPPSTSTLLANGSSPPPLPALSTDVNRNDGNSIDSKQSPPVIYPWMRKVHINNPGKNKTRRMRLIDFLIEQRDTIGTSFFHQFDI